MTPTGLAIEAVLFDLDGTLADTAPDMVTALNRLCQERGRPLIPFGQARPHVSNGSRALARLGFPAASEPELEGLIERFLDLYMETLCEGTRLFEEMHEVLHALEQDQMPWGIVTNKPARFTDPLVQKLELHERAACVISGDTLARRKPDAMPLLHACRSLGARPESCIYVGDAERDVQAGRAAGMRTLVARYGYIVAEDDPDAWKADAIIDTPLEILSWIQNGSRRKAQGHAGAAD